MAEVCWRAGWEVEDGRVVCDGLCCAVYYSPGVLLFATPAYCISFSVAFGKMLSGSGFVARGWLLCWG